jgi:hypothetical protein
LLLVLAALGLVATFVVYSREYATLPPVIPTHFGPDGTPNGWGPKSTLMIMPLVGILFFVMFVLVAPALVALKNAAPPAFPVLLRLIGAENVWLFFFGELGMISTARGLANGLGAVFFIAFAFMLATAAVTVVYGVSWALRMRAS